MGLSGKNFDIHSTGTRSSYKLDYISFCFSNIYEDAMAKVIVDGIKNYLIRLYGYYKFYDNAQDHHQSESRLTSKSMSMEMDTIDEENLSGSILVLSRYKQRREEQHSLELKNDVDRYLSDPSKELDNFDVLAWWKANEFKYRVLSKIAQDVLAVPVSTISFESAFSKGGRILDSFRSPLTPKTVEALISTQNWIHRKSVWLDIPQQLEDLKICSKIETGNSKPIYCLFVKIFYIVISQFIFYFWNDLRPSVLPTSCKNNYFSI